MHDKLTISITEYNGARHYELPKFMKKVIIYFLVVSVILVPGVVFAIVHLSKNIKNLENRKNTVIHHISGRYSRSMEKNGDLSRELSANIKEFREINGEIEFIEDMMDLETTVGLSLSGRMEKIRQVIEQREAAFKTIENRVENIEGIIGLTSSGDQGGLLQRIDRANLEALQKKILLDNVPNGCPVTFTKVTSRFGSRVHPTLGIEEFHTGVDLNAKMKTPVKVAADGVVNYSGFHHKSGFGNLLIIHHNFGFSTAYGHLNNRIVKTGEFVKKGQVVALTGNSGLSSGPHLHYEVRYNGINLNPEPFVTWGLKNYETIFRKEKKVKWESLIDLVNQRLIHSIQPSLLMAQK